jgi:hypothetical protein
MSIEEIEIGSKWKDNLKRYKLNVEITDKTANSIEFRDSAGYMSWITFEDFSRIEKSVQKVRFEKVI